METCIIYVIVDWVEEEFGRKRFTVRNVTKGTWRDLDGKVVEKG
jgi:hypothetical protein